MPRYEIIVNSFFACDVEATDEHAAKEVGLKSYEDATSCIITEFDDVEVYELDEK